MLEACRMNGYTLNDLTYEHESYQISVARHKMQFSFFSSYEKIWIYDASVSIAGRPSCHSIASQF